MSSRKIDQIDDRSPALKQFDGVWAMARHAGLENDPRVLKTLKLIRSNPGDMKINAAFARQTMAWIAGSPEYLARRQDGNPFPYPTTSVDGPIKIGQVVDPFAKLPRHFGLSLEELQQNLLAWGRAGAGKTTAFYWIVCNCLRLGIPLMVIDFKKDYRHLLRRAKSLVVFNWRTFKFNPLAPPPGTDPVYWNQVLVEIFFSAFFPSYPATSAKSAFFDLLQTLTLRYQKDHGPGVAPNFHQLAAELAAAARGGKVASGQAQRLAPVAFRLRSMLSAIGPMLDCQEGYDLNDLLTRPVVLELDGLMTEVQTFLVNALFFWIFTYRLSTGQRGRLRHALIFDEAKMVFSKTQASGSAPISRLVSTAREMGQAVVCADQMPSGLGHALLANVYTMIGLNLSATKDIHEMAYAMGLTAEQRETMNKLPVGTAIVRLADRYPRPFLIRIPNLPIDKNVSDAEVDRHMAGHLTSLKFKPSLCPAPEKGSAPSMNGNGLAQTPPAATSAAPPSAPTTGSQPISHTPPLSSGSTAAPALPFGLDARAFAYLMDVKSRPFLSKTERARALKLTAYLGNRLSRELEHQGLVKPIAIGVGRRGRTAIYLELTSKATAVVGPQELGPGKGGFEHIFHQQRLQRHFTAEGWTVRIEEFANGKSVDLGLTRGHERIAVELGMSATGELSNIEKDLAAGWPEVWEVCRDETVRAQVEREWGNVRASYPHARVLILTLTDPRFVSRPGKAPKQTP